MRLAAFLFIALLAACGKEEPQPAAPVQNSPTAMPSPDAERARAFYTQAEDHFARRDYTGALPLLEEAAELAPRDWKIHARLGHAYKQLQRYAEARAQFEVAARLTEGNERASLEGRMAVCSYRMARRAYAIGEDKLALEHVRDGLQLRPSDGPLNLMLGYVQIRRAELEEAEHAFLLAADLLAPEFREEAVLWAAHAQYRQEKYVDAVENYTRLIDGGFTGEEVFGWRAYALYSMDRHEDARRDFLRAVEFATSAEKRSEYEQAAGQLTGSGE
jgi:Flp pilus assembly protein TadD